MNTPSTPTSEKGTRLRRSVTSASEMVALSLWGNENRETLSARLANGVSLGVIAAEKGVPRSTIESLLKGLGIEIPRRKKAPKPEAPKPPVFTKNILTVLARVCRELDVNHDEIKPYLD